MQMHYYQVSPLRFHKMVEDLGKMWSKSFTGQDVQGTLLEAWGKAELRGKLVGARSQKAEVRGTLRVATR